MLATLLTIPTFLEIKSMVKHNATRLSVRDLIIELKKKKSCLYTKMIPFLEPKFQERFNPYIILLLCLNRGHGRGTDLSIISDLTSLKILI